MIGVLATIRARNEGCMLARRMLGLLAVGYPELDAARDVILRLEQLSPHEQVVAAQAALAETEERQRRLEERLAPAGQ